MTLKTGAIRALIDLGPIPVTDPPPAEAVPMSERERLIEFYSSRYEAEKAAERRAERDREAADYADRYNREQARQQAREQARRKALAQFEQMSLDSLYEGHNATQAEIAAVNNLLIRRGQFGNIEMHETTLLRLRAGRERE
jgi:hypothetical protein